MSSGADDSKNKQEGSEESLKQIVDLLKFTIALASGSLVFSLGLLLAEKIDFTCWVKFFLFSSWLSLALSAAAGVLSYMRIPVLIANQDFNMRDKFMEIPGKIHHISFIIGILSLGIAVLIVIIQK